MNAVRAIETRYAGCRFRSRLEARWAVFFSTLDVPWVYELQGFALPSGAYLPDFYLPSLDAWWEVKGQYRTAEEWQLAGELSAHTGKAVYVAWGDLPRPDGTYFDNDVYGASHRDIDIVEAVVDDDGNVDHAVDYGYAWCVCPRCDTPTVQFSGRALRHCDRQETDGRVDTARHPRVLAAYVKARSARFEHGEAA